MADSNDPRSVSSVAQVSDALRENRYLPDDGLATAVYLALRLRRPLLLEGEPGVGKTEVARVLADWIGGPLLRIQCYEGIDVNQAVYEWDYARQLLYLRTAEATGAARAGEAEALTDELYDERFLVRRPLLEAIAHNSGPSPVLLIDEVDRADDEFEAFLLEVLADYSITIPEIGTFSAVDPPVVIVTSNRTRDVHDALKRRCLYHWVKHPEIAREIEIIKLHAPSVSERLAAQVASAAAAVRQVGLYKPPGVSETIDWARALDLLGAKELAVEQVEATFPTLLKYREDLERVQDHGLEALLAAARE
ncbi:MAG: MoxR family ATPase [Acidimicrobiaceae bacterium]|nr:MoxR family ATPase [Acidimicrobiaceae bacterium]MYA75051.1 MoxR family ATPase [Acidimicrobiaceae bacterium]MYC43260.1 MoxR family ATPase [Acidimicrobiaceae bacterium]MYG55455.1 MoxR family ATPase [Acidimicrobiaceae bacterium]MYH88459.1 MoxR family ATPase [Acidimicrobiaceae bacterium]